MASTTHVSHDPHAHDHGHEHQNWVIKYLWSTDHKIIAQQYLLTAMAMGLLGGFFAYLFRMKMAFPNHPVPGWGEVSPANYNFAATQHGTIMIFFVAMPIVIAAFGNFCIPLMVGADDMVFPRLNRLSYQSFLLACLVLLSSYFVPGGGFGGAWTSYPPLSSFAKYNLTPLGSSMWAIAVAFEFVAFLLGGINFIVTAMNARAPGMKFHDVPIVVWMIVIASIMFMMSVGPLLGGVAMLLMDQNIHTHFFDPANGGDPILWQHLFWFFGHPEVYVVLLPPLGVVAEIFTVFSRKKFFGYRTVIYSMIALGIMSFFVWAHHQFIAGIDPRMANVFSATTVIISIPLAEAMFAYIATLYGGAIRYTVPMLWALGFIFEFLIGGVTGIYLGASGSDIYLHDTYFVIAHFHYTFVPIAIIGTFAGVSYWYPKMYGRMMNEFWGKVHFWISIVAINFIFIPLFFTGLAGDQRRICCYVDAFPDEMKPWIVGFRQTSTIGYLVLLAAQVIFLLNYFISMRKGPKAPDNPWEANTLEWQCPSPPPHGNFAVMPTVYRGPYEYSHPDRKTDFWPQNEPPAPSAAEAPIAPEAAR